MKSRSSTSSERHKQTLKKSKHRVVILCTGWVEPKYVFVVEIN